MTKSADHQMMVIGRFGLGVVDFRFGVVFGDGKSRPFPFRLKLQDTEEGRHEGPLEGS